jgi:hypothetical protein
LISREGGTREGVGVDHARQRDVEPEAKEGQGQSQGQLSRFVGFGRGQPLEMTVPVRVLICARSIIL